MTLLALSKILLASLATTIALGPIYWFPSVGMTAIEIVKMTLIFSCFSTTLLILNSQNTRQELFAHMKVPNLIFPLLFFILIMGLSFSDPETYDIASDINVTVYSLALAYLTLLSSLMLAIIRHDHYKMLFCASIFIVTISSIHVILTFLGIDFEHPIWWKKFAHTGLGIGRTGWSNGLALFVIVIPAYVASKNNSTNKKIFLSFFYGSLPILISQILTGGRAGILGSLLAITLFGLYICPKQYYFLLLTSLTLVVSVYITSGDNRMASTFARAIANPDEIQWKQIDQYRLDHYLFSLEQMSKSPIIGNGIAQVRYPDKNQLEIHNVFLKAGAELGIPYMLLLLSFPIYLARKFRLFYKTMPRKHILLRSPLRPYAILSVSSAITMLSGLIIAFLEPRYIYSGLGLSWAWWTSAAFLMFYANRLNTRTSLFVTEKFS